MTRYEKTFQKFRARPSWLSIAIFAVSGALLSRELSAIVVWGIETALAWVSGWTTVFLVFAPFAVSPSVPYYSSPPLDTPFALAHLIIPLAGLGIAVTVTFFWPASARLSSRLLGAIFSAEVVRTLVIAPAISSLGSRLPGGPDPVYAELADTEAIVLLLIASLVLAMIARAAVLIFGPSHDIAQRTTRALLSTVLFILPAVPLALFELFSGYLAGVFAALLLAFITFFSAIYQRRTGTWQNVASHGLTKASIGLFVGAVVLLALSVWTFGGPLAGRTFRAVWIENGIHLVDHDEILKRQLRDPESLRKRQEMRLEWSDEQERGDQ